MKHDPDSISRQLVACTNIRIRHGRGMFNGSDESDMGYQNKIDVAGWKDQWRRIRPMALSKFVGRSSQNV
jgi:hypothetical protein